MKVSRFTSIFFVCCHSGWDRRGGKGRGNSRGENVRGWISQHVDVCMLDRPHRRSLQLNTRGWTRGEGGKNKYQEGKEGRQGGKRKWRSQIKPDFLLLFCFFSIDPQQGKLAEKKCRREGRGRAGV